MVRSPIPSPVGGQYSSPTGSRCSPGPRTGRSTRVDVCAATGTRFAWGLSIQVSCGVSSSVTLGLRPTPYPWCPIRIEGWILGASIGAEAILFKKNKKKKVNKQIQWKWGFSMEVVLTIIGTWKSGKSEYTNNQRSNKGSKKATVLRMALDGLEPILPYNQTKNS